MSFEEVPQANTWSPNAGGSLCYNIHIQEPMPVVGLFVVIREHLQAAVGMADDTRFF